MRRCPIFAQVHGTKLIVSSNRNNGGTHDTNIFVADWVDQKPMVNRNEYGT